MLTKPTLTSARHSLQLVQLLRGIASLLVVLLHCTMTVNETLQQSFLFNAFKFGGAGVDIFFVLSGFIITYTSASALKKGSGFMDFVRKRFVRIYPVYWLVISLFLFLQVALPSLYRTHYEFGFANVLSTYLLFPGHVMVNGVSWTLTYEIFFYCIFSLAFLLRNRLLLIILSAIYITALVAAAWVYPQNTTGNAWADLLLFPMNVEFFMGILAALLVPKIPGASARILIGAGVLFFIASAVFFNSGYFLFDSAFNRAVLFGIPSFLLILGVVKYELATKISMHSFFIKLGEASYSLYLLHLPFVAAGIKIFSRFQISNAFVLHAVVLLMVAALCIGSIFFFKIIEKPLIDRLNRALGGKYR